MDYGVAIALGDISVFKHQPNSTNLQYYSKTAAHK
jgi:hypothetical protein